MTNYRQLLLTLPLLAILGSIATGCKHTLFSQKPKVSQIEDKLQIKTTSDKLVSLRSLWMEYKGPHAQNATIIFVPNLGGQTLEGTCAGDGTTNYERPIDVGTLWQENLVKSGYNVLAFDKRSDTTGPTELGQDLDAACDAVSKRFGRSQKIILFATELGSQIILGSRCKDSANAIAIYSPVPDTLDVLWTSALKEAGFLHRAESLGATFEAIHAGLFERDAKIMGETLTFWRNWLNQSKSSFNKFNAMNTPILFLVGEKDAYVGRNGKRLLETLTKGRKNRQFFQISRADRNLLQDEALSPRTIETTVSALKELVN